ncbi:MAG: YCF48-related protein [Blastocatellales bacterium]
MKNVIVYKQFLSRGLALLLLVSVCCNSNPKGCWQQLISDSSPDGLAVLSLTFTNSSHGWALTPFEFLESNDGGKTWQEKLSSDDQEKVFHSFTFINEKIGWIVGVQKKDNKYMAMILRTLDSGRSWQEQPVNVTAQAEIHRAPSLRSVSFCNEKVGWAVGSDLILHTTDGGLTWADQRSGNERENFYGVSCLNSERAITVGQDGVVLATEDGGKNWSQQVSGTKSTLLRVRSFGESVWAVGTNSTLLRARAGSEKWDSQQLSVAKGAGLADIVFVNSEGWIIGTEGALLHTKDGGQTWLRQKSPTETNLICVFFLDKKQGWVGGDKHTILRFSH